MESTKEKVRNRDSVNMSNVCLLGVLQIKNGVKLLGERKDENFYKVLEDTNPQIEEAL